MKTKIVLWGHDEKDEKVLIAIELLEDKNKVRVITFPENVATEEFYNQMMNLWREGQPVPFPDGHGEIERPLSMTDNLLPDTLKTSRSDILARAKTEWHFVVLSAKLYNSYRDELEDFKLRISELNSFNSAIWEEMKTFWSKVQHQVREKNLFKEHANDLRQKTNALFDDLKTLKKALDEEFEKRSKENLEDFLNKLGDIEDRIEKGLGLQPIFNELKNIQRKFRDTSFTRKDRSEVWKRLDGAFKLVKEKKFGKKQGDSSALTRINRRYQGLLSAISKMESSINRDKKEKSFQEKRIESTGGQLELQIRQAKLAMIDERISSKEQKLDEMVKTKEELEKKMAIEKKKEEKRKSKEQQEEVQVKEATAPVPQVASSSEKESEEGNSEDGTTTSESPESSDGKKTGPSTEEE